MKKIIEKITKHYKRIRTRRAVESAIKNCSNVLIIGDEWDKFLLSASLDILYKRTVVAVDFSDRNTKEMKILRRWCKTFRDAGILKRISEGNVFLFEAGNVLSKLRDYLISARLSKSLGVVATASSISLSPDIEECFDYVVDLKQL